MKHSLARSERFELPTLGFEVRCSIQLSYERASLFNGLAGHPNSLGAELGTEKAAETSFGFLDYQTWPERAMEGEGVPALGTRSRGLLARRPQLAGHPAHGVGLQGIDRKGNLLDPVAGAALEGAFLNTRFAWRDPS